MLLLLTLLTMTTTMTTTVTTETRNTTTVPQRQDDSTNTQSTDAFDNTGNQEKKTMEGKAGASAEEVEAEDVAPRSGAESDDDGRAGRSNKEMESAQSQLRGNNDNNAANSESYLHLKIHNGGEIAVAQKPSRRDLDDAIEHGLNYMHQLLGSKEPRWYKMGLYLDKSDPASMVAAFGAPSRRALQLSSLGYAALEASRKLAEMFPDKGEKRSAGLQLQGRLLEDECPIRGVPRCTAASRRYRTADGTCNNLARSWRGSSLLPFQRFLPPVFQDGVQEVRRSVRGPVLPSARDISVAIHGDRNQEVPAVNLMFMQWGQLLDHDLTSTVKARSFNGSVPQCCDRGGQDFLPADLLHPNCLPMAVSPSDPVFSQFGIRCLEFTRSAPSTRVNCNLGWREQINQATAFVDASAIYGSDAETADSLRTFRRGKLRYGRPPPQQGAPPLQPPDPPGGELCRSGALTSDCFQISDGRVGEQPGLIALHIVWLRYHNKIATVLGDVNGHWSDEKIYQETRRIVGALMQHITYKEFLPILLGQEVVGLFDLKLKRRKFSFAYDDRVNPGISNAFSTAAFRFGHSLVQNSFVRFDVHHRPLFNNVSLHDEQENIENIWSEGSLDRLLLGFSNQPSQQRDEFIADELTNHLFQSRGFPFGLDLAAINIQRGRDHGIPPYTSWRQPCGLTPIRTWVDLQRSAQNAETVHRLKLIFHHIDDIDLFTGGLAEKPVRGGLLGPTFACIIAQQFLNLKTGDRFWYENGGMESSFTPAQLQQLRGVTFSQILCQTLTEIQTIQPFVFLAPDDSRNARIPCDDRAISTFDLAPWQEGGFQHTSNEIEGREEHGDNRHSNKTVPRQKRDNKRRRRKGTTTTTEEAEDLQTSTDEDSDRDRRKKQKQTKQGYGNLGSFGNFGNVQQQQRPIYVDGGDDVTYLVGTAQSTTASPPQTFVANKPIEVNIKIQYYPPVPPTATKTTKKPKRRRPTTNRLTVTRQTTSTTTPKTYYRPIYVQNQHGATSRPATSNNDMTRPDSYSSDSFSAYRPVYLVNRPQIFDDERPYSNSYRPYGSSSSSSNSYVYSEEYPTTRRTPNNGYSFNKEQTDKEHDIIDKYYSEVLDDNLDFDTMPKKPTFGEIRGENKPSFAYSMAHIEKMPPRRPSYTYPSPASSSSSSASQIHDKLDFFRRRNNNNKNNNNDRPNSDHDDNNDDPTMNFVKISTVKGEKLLNPYSNRNVDLHVRQRNNEDGQDLDLDLSNATKTEPTQTFNNDNNNKNNWHIFNATDITFLDFPDLDFELTFPTTSELPRPITRLNATRS